MNVEKLDRIILSANDNLYYWEYCRLLIVMRYYIDAD